MQQDVLTRLTEAVRTFNARADQAATRGLRVAVDNMALGATRRRDVFHLGVLRRLPLGADLPPEQQDKECTAEIALLSAAEEVNRLVEEARRQDLKLELRLVADAKAHQGQLELVQPGALPRK